MQIEKLQPVYMVYPGLYPLLMFNYWDRTKVPIAGIMLSGYDTKIKGKILPFHKELLLFLKRNSWRYTLYMLLFAKLSVYLVSFCSLLRYLIGKEIKIKSFKQIANERGIPIYRFTDFNGKESLNFLKNVNANLIVSIYNNQVLKSRVINLPKFKTINIHPGYLPNFRGLDPAFEVLYHNVPEAGVTIHYVDTGLDTGEIILQELVPIHKNDTLFSLNVRLWIHGAMMLEKVLDAIEKEKIRSYEQKGDTKYPYCSYPEKWRIREFIKRGRRIIKFRDLINTFLK